MRDSRSRSRLHVLSGKHLVVRVKYLRLKIGQYGTQVPGCGILGLGASARQGPRSRIPDQAQIQDTATNNPDTRPRGGPGSRIQDTGITDKPKVGFQDPEPRIQNTRSPRSRIQNTGSTIHQDPESRTQNAGSRRHDPRSMIQDPGSRRHEQDHWGFSAPRFRF